MIFIWLFLIIIVMSYVSFQFLLLTALLFFLSSPLLWIASFLPYLIYHFKTATGWQIEVRKKEYWEENSLNYERRFFSFKKWKYDSGGYEMRRRKKWNEKTVKVGSFSATRERKKGKLNFTDYIFLKKLWKRWEAQCLAIFRGYWRYSGDSTHP
jgi:hypothetical protein